MIDKNGEEHIVWTCMWCGQINSFLWAEIGFAEDTRAYSGRIEMHCNFCDKATVMKRRRNP